MKQKIIYIITIVLSFFVGVVATFLVNKVYPFQVLTEKDTVRNVSITESNTIKSAIDKVYDGVVVVESYKNNQKYSSGTGFVYKKDEKNGYIITNHHVIDGAASVKIVTIDGKSVEAKILGSDEYADIAVLSIDKDAVLKVVEIGESTILELGDTLFTVGTPLDSAYMGTVTKGILSGKDRTVTVTVKNSNFMMEVLQTDAAINPGNSGGPLVNINGEVIGVNSLKLVKDEVEGMGFAIPIELVMASVDRLEKGEVIKRPLIGVELLDANNTYLLQRYGISLPDEAEGAVIASVVSGSVAEIAGLKKGDVIVEIEGIKIKNVAHFRFVLYKYNIDETIKIKYVRNEKNESADLKLKDVLE